MEIPRAVIDIGTNSVLLLVACGDEPLVDRAVVTRLGHGVDATGRLHPDAIARTLEVVRSHVRDALDLGARPVAVGTSALRDAIDADRFLVPARDIVGREVRILTGDEEAELTFLGALVGLRPADGPVTVVDVGGGSTEIVTGQGGQVSSAVSIQVGSVRLTERVLLTDPPNRDEVSVLRSTVRAALVGIAIPSRHLVAVAGTATTLAAMHVGLDAYDPGRVHGMTLSAETLSGLRKRLLSCTLDQRARIRGVEPGRAPVLPAGALILEEVVSWAGAESLTVSDRGLRWGVLRSPICDGTA